MKTWRHPDFTPDKSNMIPIAPNDIICHTCGWMYSDHEIYACESGLYCPDAPTVPGYPIDERSTGRSTDYTPVDRWKLNEYGKLLDENKDQAKRIENLQKQLRAAMCSSTCYPTRVRLENRVNNLEVHNKELEDKTKLLNERIEKGPCNRCNGMKVVAVWKSSTEQQLIDAESRINNLLDQQSRFTHQACEQQKEIAKLKRELADTLQSKTISVHNYYDGRKEWRTIDSAPRNGDLIMLAAKNWIRVGMFNRNTNGWSVPYVWTNLNDATHWSPLPEGPK